MQVEALESYWIWMYCQQKRNPASSISAPNNGVKVLYTKYPQGGGYAGGNFRITEGISER
jgi:hypothetical protein